MGARAEVLAFGCSEDDLAVLESALGPRGPTLRKVDSPADFARRAVSGRALAIVLGVGKNSLTHLDVVSVIRTVRDRLPIIVIAEEDSLELERTARQASIFYYCVHPIEATEAEAVLKDVLRYAEQ